VVTNDIPRRLAAVLAADIAGYTRLMERDEAGTVAAWRQARAEIIDPSIASHQGRIVKLTGDGFLAEFPTVESAVRCAAAMQEAFLRVFGDLPEERRVAFRMGINLGDIYVDREDIYGDGVNLAARLEGLAEPGGICVSADVYNQVSKKLNLAFHDLGYQRVKNVSNPVRAYMIAASAIGQPTEARSSPPLRSDHGRPTIAVLPFTNMSGDPEQEFFVDGLTEDIITELSRFRDLFVISRNSTFTYKGKAKKIHDVARELGAQYVVEGSVRKAGNRVRVTVQLIDAATDRHIWAERYDRELQDIFAIQDEISRAIVATLPDRVEAAAQERVNRKPTENMAAYECLLAGKVLHHRSTPSDNAEALRLLDRAIALDPQYAHAHAWKACVLGQAWRHGWCEDREATWNQAGRSLQTALALDDNYSEIHRIFASVSLIRNDHEKAIHHQERALSLNPNHDLIVVQQGELLTWLGRPEEGIEWIRQAMRLNPYHPERFWSHLGRAYYVARRYAEAADAFKHITTPDHTHHAFLAACYAQMDDADRAAVHAREVLRLAPDFTVGEYLKILHYKQEADLAHHREGLLKAGLPQ
jgi:adenylate cyclase